MKFLGTLAIAVAVVAVLNTASAHDGIEVNPALGVPGFPNCEQTVPRSEWGQHSVDSLARSLRCHQRPKARATQTSVACIGDSITAGVHSTGGNATYPGQLQIMLGDDYVVTNLGACGSTMLKHGNSPYWERPQYKTLVANTWDIAIIMLGTNDSKDKGDGGPSNWPHDCTGEGAHTCSFAQDYAAMIKLVRGLGNPKIYIAIPPPLHLAGVYGMNYTVINDVFPTLIPIINEDNQVPNDPIDIFTAMGGNMLASFPPNGCTVDTTVADCQYYCDSQSCDQCHPNNVGYHHMAAAMKAGLGL